MVHSGAKKFISNSYEKKKPQKPNQALLRRVVHPEVLRRSARRLHVDLDNAFSRVYGMNQRGNQAARLGGAMLDSSRQHH